MTCQKMAIGLTLTATLVSFIGEATWCLGASLPKPPARHSPRTKAVVTPTTTVPFTAVQRYFVKNTVKAAPTNPRIDDQATFNKLFGAAAVM